VTQYQQTDRQTLMTTNILLPTYTTMEHLSALYVRVKVFEGNVDSYSVKHAYLDEPIVARFVKFHTIHWNQHPSMRVELVGCQGNDIDVTAIAMMS